MSDLPKTIPRYIGTGAADDILETVAEYCQRINDSAH